MQSQPRVRGLRVGAGGVCFDRYERMRSNGVRILKTDTAWFPTMQCPPHMVGDSGQPQEVGLMDGGVLHLPYPGILVAPIEFYDRFQRRWRHYNKFAPYWTGGPVIIVPWDHRRYDPDSEHWRELRLCEALCGAAQEPDLALGVRDSEWSQLSCQAYCASHAQRGYDGPQTVIADCDFNGGGPFVKAFVPKWPAPHPPGGLN